MGPPKDFRTFTLSDRRLVTIDLVHDPVKLARVQLSQDVPRAEVHVNAE